MGKLVAEQLRSDPRVRQAKKLLLEALADHQQSIENIREPDVELIESYQDLVNEFNQLRGWPLIYSYLGSGMGKGALVELADGSIKYDFISGIGVHHWGHCHPAIVEASVDAALGDTIMQGNLQQNMECVPLARLLVSSARRYGAELDHCFFSTSGVMANENALKMLFQAKTPADRVLAFEGCFMGRTLAASHITDKSAYREGLPALMSTDYVPFFDANQPRESTTRAVDTLKRHLKRYPGKHAVMCFELIQGENGFYPGDRDFFVALMEILKEHDIPVMIDEIQTFGRTSELFAFQSFGLDSFVDVVTIGKLSQVCATLYPERLTPRPGLLSQTFTAGTSSIAAAQVIIQGLLDGDYFGPDGKIARYHQHCVTRLKEIEERHPDLISGPYGQGAMIAFTPLDGDAKTVGRLTHALFQAGVICFYAGSNPTRIRFLIPVGAIGFQDIDTVCSIVERTLIEVAAQ